MKLAELFNQTKIDEDGMVFVGFGSDYEKLKEAIKEPSVTYPGNMDIEEFVAWINKDKEYNES